MNLLTSLDLPLIEMFRTLWYRVLISIAIYSIDDLYKIQSWLLTETLPRC